MMHHDNIRNDDLYEDAEMNRKLDDNHLRLLMLI